MKTLIAVVVLIFAGTSVFASGNLRVNLNGINAEMTSVEISIAKISNFDIHLADETGRVIFSKQTQSPSTTYNRKYDFSRLNDGMYFLTVKVDKETNKTKFFIENGDVQLIGERKTLEPFFKFDEKQLKMTFLNFANEEATLIVYDNNRNQLYSKNFNSDFNIQHGINMSNLPKGLYEVVLATDYNVYDYSVTVE